MIKTICLIMLFCLSMAHGQLLLTKPVPNDSSAVCTHFDQQNGPAPDYTNLRMPFIANTGVGWIRDDINWSKFELTKGVYTVHAGTLAWINAAHAAGLKVVGLVEQYFPPAFYTTINTPWFPATGDSTSPLGHFLVWATSINSTTGQPNIPVDCWEIYNEPNNSTGDWTVYTTWEQGVAVSTSIATDAVHSVNPNMPVIGLGGQGAQILQMLSFAPHVNGVVFHDHLPIAEQIYEPPYTDLVTWVTALRKAAPGVQLWLTEQGIGDNGQIDDTSNYTEVDTAAWLTKKWLLFASLNVEHSFFYAFLPDGQTSPEALFTYGGDPTQAYFTMQRLNALLLNVHPISGQSVAVTSTDPLFDFTNNKTVLFQEKPGNPARTVVGIWTGNSAFNWAAGTNGFGGAVKVHLCDATFPLDISHWYPHPYLLDPITGEAQVVPSADFFFGTDTQGRETMTVRNVPVGGYPIIIVAE